MGTHHDDVMNLRRLRYFVAVAEELHFGRAAARLNIAQPPLSRKIAQLENDLGVVLVDRSRSQIALTQAGSVLFDRAREILSNVEETEHEVARIGQGLAGYMRIAFVGSASHGILPEIIRSFRNAYSEVDLVLSAMNNAELKRAIVQRQIDIAIARPSLDDRELKSQALHHEPLILAVPIDAAILRNELIRLANLKDETFVLYPRKPRPSFADHILTVCRKEGFEPKSPIFAQDYQTAISLVSVGAGVSLVPLSVSESERHGVTYRTFSGYNPGTALSLNYRRDNRSPHLFNFLKIAQQFRRRLRNTSAG